MLSQTTCLSSSLGLLEHYRTRNDDDTDNDHDDLEEIFVSKKRGIGREYLFQKNFQSLEAAIESINSTDERWSCKNKKVGLDGKKHYYICKKARGFTCQTSLYILEHPDKTAGIFRCSNMAHNHPVQCPVKVGINPETKTEIEKLYNSIYFNISIILS